MNINSLTLRIKILLFISIVYFGRVYSQCFLPFDPRLNDKTLFPEEKKVKHISLLQDSLILKAETLNKVGERDFRKNDSIGVVINSLKNKGDCSCEISIFNSTDYKVDIYNYGYYQATLDARERMIIKTNSGNKEIWFETTSKTKRWKIKESECKGKHKLTLINTK